ncbi:hypothetical protein [Picosynechococcus sp. NKBG15041c]|uniref:hypothetical protein n=1 Tax=Picosynechococcus sp. NKBG15041c TaxID=1407650 RepID=UPI0011DCFBF4|nr:hypothetical protein [Picosynechococcus sp. NKBG15041c]
MSLFKSVTTAFIRIKNFFVYNPNKAFNNTKSFLGNNTKVGKGTNINGIAFIGSNKNSPVLIGKYCAIGHNLRIRPTNHHTGYANLQVKFQKNTLVLTLPLVKDQ